MITRKEIKAKYKKLHDVLTLVFYQAQGKYTDEPAPTTKDIASVEAALGEPITGLDKANFNRIHGKIWSDMDAELTSNGFVEPAVDWQTEWDGAAMEDKIRILARMLGIQP